MNKVTKEHTYYNGVAGLLVCAMKFSLLNEIWLFP